jgi:hypothetical protein
MHVPKERLTSWQLSALKLESLNRFLPSFHPTTPPPPPPPSALLNHDNNNRF